MTCNIIARTTLPNVDINDLGISICNIRSVILSDLFSKNKLANSADLANALNNGSLQILYDDIAITDISELCKIGTSNVTTTLPQTSCWQENIQQNISAGIKSLKLIDRVSNEDFKITNIFSRQIIKLYVDNILQTNLPVIIPAGTVYKLVYEEANFIEDEIISADIRCCKDSADILSLACWQQIIELPELASTIANFKVLEQIINSPITLNNIFASSPISVYVNGLFVDEFPLYLYKDDILSLFAKGSLTEKNITLEFNEAIKTVIQPPVVTSPISTSCCQPPSFTEAISREYSLSANLNSDMDYTITPIKIVQKLTLALISSNANYEAFYRQDASSNWQNLTLNIELLPGYEVRYRYKQTLNISKPTLNVIYYMNCPITITNNLNNSINVADLGALTVESGATVVLSDMYSPNRLAKSADLETNVINQQGVVLAYKGIEITDITQLCVLKASDRIRYLECFILSETNTDIDTDFFVSEDLTTVDLPFVISSDSTIESATADARTPSNLSAFSFEFSMEIQPMLSSGGYTEIVPRTQIGNTNRTIDFTGISIPANHRLRIRYYNAGNTPVPFPRLTIKIAEN